jgi:uncharacterized membrane protein (UPF0182 family)
MDAVLAVLVQLVTIASPMFVYAYLTKVFLELVNFSDLNNTLTEKILHWIFLGFATFCFICTVTVIVKFRGGLF